MGGTLEAQTQIAGTDPKIHGNRTPLRVDPTTGGLLVHQVTEVVPGTFNVDFPTNTTVSILPIDTRVESVNSADFENPFWRGAHFIIEVQSISGNAISVEIQGKNPHSGNYYPVLISLPMIEPGIRVLKIHPKFYGMPFKVAGDFLPAWFRVKVTHLNSAPVLYSIDATLSL